MTGFLSSLKADLLDRRLLPGVILVALVLVAALAYAVLGGGSSTATPAAVVPTGPPIASTGLAATQVTPEKAVAETTGGVSTQHRGSAHNPFTPLPETKAKTAASTAAATTSASSSSSSATSGSSGASSPSAETPTTPTTPSKPAKPAKPKTLYHVAVLFGALPAGGTAESALTPYEDLALLTPLPYAKEPLIVFRGVTAGGKSAAFTLVGEAILHGNADCLPSTTQCEAIDLQAGQSEQLEYVLAGEPVTYELKIVSIVPAAASEAAVKSVLHGESRAGRELLGHDGLMALPDLRYSARAGVLVFAAHPAVAVRSARAAARSRHSR